MGRTVISIGTLMAAAFLATAHAANAREAAGGRYVTGPQPGDAVDIAIRVLERGGAGAGRSTPNYRSHRVADRYESRRSGATHLVLRQMINGLEVWNGDAIVNVAPDGSVMSAHDRFVAGASPRAGAVPGLTAEEALDAAAFALGLDPPSDLRLLDVRNGAARESRYDAPEVSLDPIPVKLMYQADDADRLHLVWNLVLREPGGGHWWNLNVDAETGEIRSRVDYRRDDAYRVFDLPLESPDQGPRSWVVDPADAAASPFGWHDFDGIAGADSTTTTGNNAFVDADRDGSPDTPDLAAPSGGPSLSFDLPLDLSQPPGNSVQAAITQAFYVANRAHDIHHHYGFDEASGNFQLSNYGEPGADVDPMLIDVQDAAERNNAQILVPPDGGAARMELYLFDPSLDLTVASPPAIMDRYKAAGASFGPAVGNGPTALVVLASDGAAPQSDGCTPLVNSAQVSGNIALVDRGDCFFQQKVLNAQAAGAIAVVIANHLGDDVFTMGPADPPLPDPAIPAILIGRGDGQLIRAALGQGVVATVGGGGNPDRDAALDTGLILHEYGHGVSIRRTGGPSNAVCLESLQSKGMGEGWSDFWALALTAKTSDQPTDPRAIAAYVLSDSLPVGFRNFPYTTDLALNPQTYADLTGLTEEHDVGELWAAGLWEVYWNLVAEQEFDPDLTTGTGGNNTTLQLVMDALPLQPCNPTLLDGRDAILLADVASSGGQNACAIWTGFAKRGMGLAADDGGTATTNQVVAAFDVPVQCPEPGAALLGLVALATNVWLRKRLQSVQAGGSADTAIALSGRHPHAGAVSRACR